MMRWNTSTHFSCLSSFCCLPLLSSAPYVAKRYLTPVILASARPYCHGGPQPESDVDDRRARLALVLPQVNAMFGSETKRLATVRFGELT